MKRRDVIAHLGATLACSQNLVLATTSLTSAADSEISSHLDMREARKARGIFLVEEALIPNGRHDTADLDLSQYSSADLDAINYLAPLNGGFTYLGFEKLSPDMAEILSQWKSYFFCFDGLQSLCGEAAVHLGNTDAGHGLAFDIPMKLDAQTTMALARNGSPLNFNFKTEPDLLIAQALATHQHEMGLHFQAALSSPSVAMALSRHAGYLLNLYMASRPSEPVLQALSSNPKKTVSTYFPYESEGVMSGIVSIDNIGFRYGGF
jgi:hypothetical protein